MQSVGQPGLTLFKRMGPLPEFVGDKRVAQRTKEDQRYPEIKRCQLNAVAQDFPQPRKLAVAVAVQRGRNGGGGKRGRQQQ